MRPKDDSCIQEGDISMEHFAAEQESRDDIGDFPPGSPLTKSPLRQRTFNRFKDGRSLSSSYKACDFAHSTTFAHKPMPPVVDPDPSNAPPPSFAQSEFETIVRRQRNNQPHTLKVHDRPSRFPNLSNLWEFAGWGSMSYVELTTDDFASSDQRMMRPREFLTTLQAISIAGNDMYGSVFYAFPAVAAVAGILSPLALLIACLLLWLFRPILLELGSAIRFDGAVYSYFLQTSGKAMALVAVSAMILDTVATASVASATASAYISGEVDGALWGMKEAAVAIGIILLLGAVGLFRIRESSGVTLSFTILHLLTLTMLMLASIVAWARQGSDILAANWDLRPHGSKETVKAIFFGTCIAFLGVTGFEMTPTYIQHIRPESYDTTVTTGIITVTVLNAPLMLMVYALLPSDTILSGGNVLSLLAEKVAGKWLRYLVIIDCVLVVGGGCVLAGLIGITGMLQMLARDNILPKAFLRTLPSGGAHWAVCFFVTLSLLLYASSGFTLSTISGVFSVSFPFVLLMYFVANLMLKFNRDRIPRQYSTSILLTFVSIGAITAVLIGNVILTPKILALFLAYYAAILASLLFMHSRLKFGRIAMWLYDQTTFLHKAKVSKGWHGSIVRWMTRLRKRPIAVWVKGDEIHNILAMILYVRRNETTSRIIFIHAYESAMEIPSELEANVKILDEAFPSITLDLVFVKGHFNPTLVDAVSAKLEVPKNQMFMNTMTSSRFSLADYDGVRIVSW